MDRTTKRTLWIVAAVVVFIALVATQHFEWGHSLFCVIVPSIICTRSPWWMAGLR